MERENLNILLLSNILHKIVRCTVALRFRGFSEVNRYQLTHCCCFDNYTVRIIKLTETICLYISKGYIYILYFFNSIITSIYFCCINLKVQLKNLEKVLMLFFGSGWVYLILCVLRAVLLPVQKIVLTMTYFIYKIFKT